MTSGVGMHGLGGSSKPIGPSPFKSPLLNDARKLGNISKQENPNSYANNLYDFSNMDRKNNHSTGV